jgi:alanine dehydrogenase
MLFLDNEVQANSITPGEALDALRAGLGAYQRGDAMRRPRIDNIIPTSRPGSFFDFSSMEGGIRGGYYALRIKPDIREFPSVLGSVRIVSYHKKVGQYGGLVFLFDVETAELVAMMNDGYVQHMRVAASAALGVQYLAKPDAKVLAFIGSGGMAQFFPQLIREVRPIERIQVFSPNPDNMKAYAEKMSAELGIDVVPAKSAQEVCKGADIVCTCTTSADPVLYGEWIEPGTHVNNVTFFEMSDSALARIETVGIHIERTPMAVTPLVDDQYALRFGVMSWAVGTPSELAVWPDGKPPAVRYPNAKNVRTCDWDTGVGYKRRSDDEVTILSNHSHGTVEGDAGISAGTQGVQFAAVAGKIYENARARNLGKELPSEMFVQDIPT